ncbi:MAG: ABC transporter transmembrane domain-containing protein [Lachnospirales bacterium]
MFKLVKKINPIAAIIAIAFLIVQAACDLYIPTITTNIVDKGVVTNNMAYIWNQGTIMIALTTISFIAAVLNAFFSSRLANRFGARLRGEVYRKAMSFSNDEFDKIGTSSLITRNTNDVKRVQTLVEDGLDRL